MFFFQAEDGIRDLVRSRGLGDVYKRQVSNRGGDRDVWVRDLKTNEDRQLTASKVDEFRTVCLLYTSDAADERSSVDLGGRRIIQKKKNIVDRGGRPIKT